MRIYVVLNKDAQFAEYCSNFQNSLWCAHPQHLTFSHMVCTCNVSQRQNQKFRNIVLGSKNLNLRISDVLTNEFSMTQMDESMFYYWKKTVNQTALYNKTIFNQKLGYLENELQNHKHQICIAVFASACNICF